MQNKSQLIQIICQHDTKKCLYLNQTNYDKLRSNLCTDFDDLLPNFEMMYIDQAAGDWMLIQSQADLDLVLKIRKDYALFKILPKIQRISNKVYDRLGSNGNCKERVGKLIISDKMKEMIEYISQKHIEKYIHKKMTQKMMQVSDMMLEEKIPAARTKFQPISTQVQNNLRISKPQRRSQRISPFKQQKQKIQKAVNRKLSKTLQQLIESTFQATLKNFKCNNCLKSQLEVKQLIRLSLMKKINDKNASSTQFENPQQI